MSERNGHTFIPLEFEHLSTEEQLSRAREFESRMRTRRTVRKFSPRQVPRELIETALRIASRAPSGANQQPWRFVVILDPEIKRKIRVAAEAEERDNYERRSARVAGCTGRSRDRLAQRLSRDCALSHQWRRVARRWIGKL